MEIALHLFALLPLDPDDDDPSQSGVHEQVRSADVSRYRRILTRSPPKGLHVPRGYHPKQGKTCCPETSAFYERRPKTRTQNRATPPPP